MSIPGVLFILAMLGAGFVVYLTLKGQNEHQLRAQGLRERYSAAKATGDPRRIIPAARAILNEFSKSNRASLPRIAEELYHDALGLLGRNSELRPFALEMGRFAYGVKRPDRKPTVYDEQAITNDLQAHQ